MFCCNDERGNFTGRIEHVAIDEENITLVGPSITYRVEERGILVGRRRFSHIDAADWVGHWFWNSATLHTQEAKRLVSYLLERGWRAEEWPSDGPFASLFTVAPPPMPAKGR
jgi:hypothetical protein